MINYENMKEYIAFRLDCPHLYKDCGSIEPKSNCAKCFKDGKYNTKNGHSNEEVMKKENADFNKMVEMANTLSR
ncbi:MAG: hypothetical protein K2M23_03065 [Alphaproteobacteria bacterium]|nr:hypothetical protein [Alphaproteobacteria bacterium]